MVIDLEVSRVVGLTLVIVGVMEFRKSKEHDASFSGHVNRVTVVVTTPASCTVCKTFSITAPYRPSDPEFNSNRHLRSLAADIVVMVHGIVPNLTVIYSCVSDSLFEFVLVYPEWKPLPVSCKSIPPIDPAE